MRAHITLLGILAYGSVFAGNQAGSLSEAMRLSETLKKPILIGFFVPACWVSKAFISDSHSDKEVVDALNQVILLNVNVNGEEGVELRRKFGVRGVPGFLLIEDGGNKIVWTGYQKKAFLAKLYDALKIGPPQYLTSR